MRVSVNSVERANERHYARESTSHVESVVVDDVGSKSDRSIQSHSSERRSANAPTSADQCFDECNRNIVSTSEIHHEYHIVRMPSEPRECESESECVPQKTQRSRRLPRKLDDYDTEIYN